MRTVTAAWRVLRLQVEERPPIQINLPLVLSGCETLSLSFKEECGLKVFENSVTRRIYELKRDEVKRM